MGCVGNTWRGLLAGGESPRQVQEGRKLGGSTQEEREKQAHVGTGIGHRQRQRWAGWAAGGDPALGPGGAKEEEKAGTRTRWVLCLGGRGAGRRLPSAAPLSWRGPEGGGETVMGSPDSRGASLTVGRGQVGPFHPRAPALSREVIETRHPPLQSGHCCRRAFTHRHHRRGRAPARRRRRAAPSPAPPRARLPPPASRLPPLSSLSAQAQRRPPAPRPHPRRAFWEM